MNTIGFRKFDIHAGSARFILPIILCVSMSACTDPGETTAVSAATGGVIGAGLGAIVGNQTGDTGTGFVVGALAGGAAGAAVGNALEAQEESLRTQDEAIERQEKMIQAQTSEIAELRRSSGDSPRAAYPRSYQGPRTQDQGRVVARAGSVPSYSNSPRLGNTNSASTAPLASRDITPSRSSESSRFESTRSNWSDQFDSGSANTGAVDSGVEARLDRAETALSNESGSLADNTNDSAECVQARAEHDRAMGTEETSEQLFHLRRALRLCPGQAPFHSSLGEVYLKLNRKEDAIFEFKEALRIDPNQQTAQANLRLLESGANTHY